MISDFGQSQGKRSGQDKLSHFGQKIFQNETEVVKMDKKGRLPDYRDAMFENVKRLLEE